jgi:hypothetical protein
MAIRDIARPLWSDELDRFSRQHEGWIVSIAAQTDGNVSVQARDIPLRGVAVASSERDAIEIAVGGGREHVTHPIEFPTAVRLELTGDGAERALIIESANGTTTRLEFRSPMRPEDVDGLPNFPEP